MNNVSFSVDEPIAKAEEDRLNRTGFAEALASAIRNWTKPSSLVIGLYGEWGSGKSSLKNLVVERLHEGVEAG